MFGFGESVKFRWSCVVCQDVIRSPRAVLFCARCGSDWSKLIPVVSFSRLLGKGVFVRYSGATSWAAAANDFLAQQAWCQVAEGEEICSVTYADLRKRDSGRRRGLVKTISDCIEGRRRRSGSAGVRKHA